MKTLKLICLSCFLIFTSCEKEKKSSNPVESFVGKWDLIKRHTLLSPNTDIEITKSCTIEIFGDNNVMYTDSLLGFYNWDGVISFDTETFAGYNSNGVDFGNSYLFSFNFDEGIDDDTLYTAHFLPNPFGTPYRYYDTYVRVLD